MFYSRSDWEETETELAALPMTHESEHAKRMMLGRRTALDMTSQRELIIPDDFRDYAKLVEDIVFIGCGQFIEILSAESWQVDLQKSESEFIEIPADLTKLLL
jgi:division/cell wall cluster transcriptional repressor MraZ